MVCNESSCKREVHSDKSPHIKKQKKFNLILLIKELEKKQIKPNVSKRKEIPKTRE